jgi:hypothetical protein
MPLYELGSLLPGRPYACLRAVLHLATRSLRPADILWDDYRAAIDHDCDHLIGAAKKSMNGITHVTRRPRVLRHTVFHAHMVRSAMQVHCFAAPGMKPVLWAWAGFRKHRRAEGECQHKHKYPDTADIFRKHHFANSWAAIEQNGWLPGDDLFFCLQTGDLQSIAYLRPRTIDGVGR